MAFTEFYCQAGGSNLNSGSTNNNAATYTSNSGNWNGSTTFIPTDGSTPASSISVGDFASVFLSAAVTGVYIARITGVANGINGAITLSTATKAGTAPSSGATGRNIRVGGACKGPTGAGIGYPMSLSGWGLLVNLSGNAFRLNLKNDATYSLTSAASFSSSSASVVVQGYTSTPGDLGKATIQSSSASVIVTPSSSITFSDLIFTTTSGIGSQDMIGTSAGNLRFNRCVLHGARGSAISTGGNLLLYECELYDNNKSNTTQKSSITFAAGGGAYMQRSVFHDNTSGSNASGVWLTAANSVSIQNCIFDSCAGDGLTAGTGAGTGFAFIENCDFYNNDGNGINIAGAGGYYRIENCNFIKNGGAAILNGSTPPGNCTGAIFNNGYGSGAQANGMADTLGPIEDDGSSVIYPSGFTPWVNPVNGDFRIRLAQARSTGRGAFQQTAASYAGTLGYPDIGSAQSRIGSGGETSMGVG